MRPDEARGIDGIAPARKRLEYSRAAWHRLRWWNVSARLAAIAMPIVTLGVRIAGGDGIAMVAGASIGAMLSLAAGRRLSGTSVRLVAQHLDRRLPMLEDSCELLLSDSRSMSPLEDLQARKIAQRVLGLEDSTLKPDRSWRPAFLAWSTAALASLLIAGWPTSAESPPAHNLSVPGDESEDSAVVAVRVEVEAPAYTDQASRRVEGMNLEALEGSRLTWSIETSGSVHGVELSWMNGAGLPAEEVRPSFWQTVVDLESSRLYEIHLACDAPPCPSMGPARIEMIDDEPPRIQILDPPRVVVLERGSTQGIDLDIEIADDYGLSQASLVYTLATGSGESVRFRERRQRLPEVAGALREQRVEAHLGLEKIGFENGAELYYYVEAFDARRPKAQRGRSATHLLRKPGGESAVQVATLPLGIDLTARFLRSQRQIILDTETLIASRATLREDEFELRSHALVFDQRALRMRYATLLGDEFSSGQVGQEHHLEREGREEGEEGGEKNDPNHADHDNEAGRPPGEEPKLGNPGSLLAALPPGFVHMHDSEQSGSMLAGSVQATLRGAIAEMFEAERELSVYDPEAALPAEYRALKKLKEAQEAERLYVRKAGLQGTPLDEKKRRFQGELDEIRDRRGERIEPTPTGEPDVQIALQALERWMREGHRPKPSDASALAKARVHLAEKALGSDAVPLEGLRSLRDIEASLERSKALECDDCLPAAIRALRFLLTSPPAQPDPRNALSKLDLLYRETRP